jgi:uncharacterized protein (DUF1501 family)
MSINRREFLMGCSSAIAAMTGGQLTQLALAAPGTANANDEMLVVIFLRGAWDALNVLPVLDGPDRVLYEEARPNLKIPTRGEGAAIPLTAQFGLHRGLEPLLDLYKDKRLAIIPASGMPSDTRSHFDAMDYMELGTPDNRNTKTGWIARHLQTAPRSASGLNVLSGAIAIGQGLPTSLLGHVDSTAMESPDDFKLIDDPDTRKRFEAALARLYDGETWLHRSAQKTLAAVQAVARAGFKEYQPAKGANYPEDSSLGASLRTVARIIKQGLGVRTATVDFGGWDTHEYQSDGAKGYFTDLLSELAGSLRAFYEDLENTPENHARRTTVVVMSEFGRRLAQNASYGTDHGHGSLMMVLGGSVNGGKLYGKWPGLALDQLYDRADLAVTTDYRTILSEILIERFKNTRMDTVFPEFKMGQGLGIV